jgi:hypothetical protein
MVSQSTKLRARFDIQIIRFCPRKAISPSAFVCFLFVFYFSITFFSMTMAPSAVVIKASEAPSKMFTKAELKLDGDQQHDIVLRTFRCLIADLCEQFKGGHPG